MAATVRFPTRPLSIELPSSLLSAAVHDLTLSLCVYSVCMQCAVSGRLGEGVVPAWQRSLA